MCVIVCVVVCFECANRKTACVCACVSMSMSVPMSVSVCASAEYAGRQKDRCGYVLRDGV